MSPSGILSDGDITSAYWKHKLLLPFKIVLTIIFRKVLAWHADKILKRFSKEDISYINNEVWGNQEPKNREHAPDIYKALNNMSNFKTINSNEIISPFIKQMSWEYYRKMMDTIKYLERYLFVDFKKIPTMLNAKDPEAKAILKSRLVLGK